MLRSEALSRIQSDFPQDLETLILYHVFIGILPGGSVFAQPVSGPYFSIADISAYIFQVIEDFEVSKGRKLIEMTINLWDVTILLIRRCPPGRAVRQPNSIRLAFEPEPNENIARLGAI